MTLTDERVLQIERVFFFCLFLFLFCFVFQFCLKSTGAELIYEHLSSGKSPSLPIKPKIELFKYKRRLCLVGIVQLGVCVRS